MKLIVGTNKIEVDESDSLNESEYNAHTMFYEFDEAYEGLVKMATFVDENGKYAVEIVNGQCMIPYEILKTEGTKEFGVYGYILENEELILRYSPTPIKKKVAKGSYKDQFDNYEEPTPTELDQIRNDIVRANDNIDIILDKVEGIEEEIGEIGNTLDIINGEVV